MKIEIDFSDDGTDYLSKVAKLETKGDIPKLVKLMLHEASVERWRNRWRKRR